LTKNTLLFCHYADFKVRAEQCPAGKRTAPALSRGLSKLNSVAPGAHDHHPRTRSTFSRGPRPPQRRTRTCGVGHRIFSLERR